MTFADKTTLGQSAILGLMYVFSLYHVNMILTDLKQQSWSTPQCQSVQLAGIDILLQLLGVSIPPELGPSIFSCGEMDEVRFSLITYRRSSHSSDWLVLIYSYGLLHYFRMQHASHLVGHFSEQSS